MARPKPGKLNMLAAELRHVIDNEGSGVTESARCSGLTRRTLYRWLAGKVKPDRNNLLKLFKAVGAEPNTVLRCERLRFGDVDPVKYLVTTDL